MNIVGESMGDSLRRLQTVKPYDYDGAYRAAFRGGHCLRPAKDKADAAWLQGCCLALELWVNRMYVTNGLAAARAAEKWRNRTRRVQS